jgi:hypothetical protein
MIPVFHNFYRDPYQAIAARGDLQHFPVLHGAVDGKVAGYRDVRELTCQIIGGPTTEDGNEPFDFADIDEGQSLHNGIPSRWDFDWFEVPFIPAT